MKQTRRSFLGTAALCATSLWCTGAAHATPSRPRAGKKRLVLRFSPYTLEMKHAFNIASSSRATTPVMLTEIEFDGVVGYGEASMPPYLGESQQTAAAFLSRVDLGRFDDPFRIADILAEVDATAPGNAAAKASVDIALHDLVGKLLGKPWHVLWGLDRAKTPHTSFTIGLDKPDVVRQKTREAAGYRILKVKIGRGSDREMIEAVRSITSVPICVDVNQGWTDRSQALESIHWLKEAGCVFVEQPMPKERWEDAAWLTERSPLPIMGDECVQRLKDVKKAWGAYSGINVKLMKCTGMREAHEMIITARALGMKVMIGCMTETSCAVSAAGQLSPLVDWADLDGAVLIKNDIFDGMKIVDGRVTLDERPGIGVARKRASG